MSKTKISVVYIIAFTLSWGGSYSLTKILRREIPVDVDTTKAVVTDSVPEAITAVINDSIPDSTNVVVTDTTPDATTLKNDSIVHDRITKPQYKQMLENGRGDYIHDRRRISRNLSYKAIHLREGDPGLRDGLATIQTNITLNYWIGIRILTMTYDERGRVASFTISPIYPEDTPEIEE